MGPWRPWSGARPRRHRMEAADAATAFVEAVGAHGELADGGYWTDIIIINKIKISMK